MTMKPKTKSDATRAKIEAGARKLFEEKGYERTTVRDIAAAAHIDPAMVIRYFGSKDELFRRVAEPRLQLPDLAAIDRSCLGELLVSRFLEIWESDDGVGGMAVLLRSAASNDAAADGLRQIFARQVIPAIGAVGSPATASLRAGLVSSQLLGLALSRYVLKLPPVTAMDRATIVREVGATIQRYVTLDEV
jgi:AcrR family transcriptional regulator